MITASSYSSFLPLFLIFCLSQTLHSSSPYYNLGWWQICPIPLILFISSLPIILFSKSLPFISSNYTSNSHRLTLITSAAQSTLHMTGNLVVDMIWKSHFAVKESAWRQRGKKGGMGVVEGWGWYSPSPIYYYYTHTHTHTVWYRHCLHDNACHCYNASVQRSLEGPPVLAAVRCCEPAWAPGPH